MDKTILQQINVERIRIAWNRSTASPGKHILDTICRFYSTRRNSSGYSVYCASPEDIRKNGSDSWQRKSNNQNLDGENAKKLALDLESRGFLIRVVPVSLCQSDKWRTP